MVHRAKQLTSSNGMNSHRMRVRRFLPGNHRKGNVYGIVRQMLSLLLYMMKMYRPDLEA